MNKPIQSVGKNTLPLYHFTPLKHFHALMHKNFGYACPYSMNISTSCIGAAPT